jgi:hypothetical protein
MVNVAQDVAVVACCADISLRAYCCRNRCSIASGILSWAVFIGSGVMNYCVCFDVRISIFYSSFLVCGLHRFSLYSMFALYNPA